jgi:hypothetical protein
MKQNKKTASIIEFVYKQTTIGIPLEILKNELDVA